MYLISATPNTDAQCAKEGRLLAAGGHKFHRKVATRNETLKVLPVPAMNQEMGTWSGGMRIWPRIT